MTLNELIKVVDGKCLNKSNLDIEINSIKTDTRKLVENDVFIALKGKKYDGHNYIKEAIEKSVMALIINDNIEIDSEIPIIKVNDTYDAMGKIANYLRHKYDVKVIGVTGSNGKTTTKELIYDILSTKYNVLKSVNNNNNIVGLTHTLFNLNDQTEIVLLEMGMNHSNEISVLSKIANPDIGIITNIGTSHIGLLKSKKNIYKAKLEILDGMKNGLLIVNGDDRYLRKIKDSYKCGTNSYNDLIAYNIYSNSTILSFNIFIDKEYQVRFNSPSTYFINDILLAIKTCLLFGIDINTIIEKINNYKMVEKRMNIIKIQNNTLIDDCYNSNFESLKGGLEYLSKINNNKLIILGDMLELGRYSKKYHKKINKYLKKIDDKIVLTVGNYSKYIKGLHFSNNNELLEYLKYLELDNYYIYIKGSRGMNLDLIVKYFKDEYISI